jgi:23S rRNA pseudouridine2605 synthase
MPRDKDKDKDNFSPRGSRDRGPSKGRSGKPRGPEKKFAKRGFGAGERDKGDREARAPRGEGRPFRRRDDSAAPRGDFKDRPRFKRDDRQREERGDRPFKPRGDRPNFNRDDRPRGERSFADRPPRDGEKRSFKPRGDRPAYRDRDESRPSGRSGERKFGDKRPYAPRGDRPERKFDGDRKFSRGGADRERDRGDRPRGDRRAKDFGGRDRGDEKPWRQRDDRRQGGRDEDRPRFSRSRDDRPSGDRPKFDRPRQRPEGRSDWQEHPRSEGRFSDRPRRDNEDDSRIFAKRPAFGGRGAYRQRERDFDRRPRREEAPKPKKAGERIAKVLARAGLASRRDAEEMVMQGRVSVNGRVINSPALDVTRNDVVAVDGKPLPPRERTRLFLYHKPRGLMTTHDDPEGRPTVFDNLPEGLPRLISIGRLDFNTEGLLLLTNDGGLARTLELPDTGWLRRYRVRAHGEVTQAQLDELKNGIEVEGVKYGPIDATLERDQGANVWLVFAIREGKNREVRNVLAHLGLEVNRLIRVSYGPFQLAELAEGAVDEVRSRVLREQLGEKIARQSGAEFDTPARPDQRDEVGASREKKPFKPSGKSALIADRKGRRVLVQRTGDEEARARNEDEAAGYGPPRRPKRGYHGKRDFKPRDGQE